MSATRQFLTLLFWLLFWTAWAIWMFTTAISHIRHGEDLLAGACIFSGLWAVWKFTREGE